MHEDEHQAVRPRYVHRHRAVLRPSRVPASAILRRYIGGLQADQGVFADEIIWHAHRDVTRERPIRQDELVEDSSVALLFFARDRIHVFDLVRDKETR